MTEEKNPDFHVGDLDLEAKNRVSRLREAVRSTGGNQVVAEKSGVKLGTLAGYLAGGEMKLSNAIILARTCGVRLEWLATGNGPMNETAPIPSAGEAPIASQAQPGADIDLTVLARCLQLVEEVSEIGKEPANALTRLRRAFGAYRLIVEEKAK